MKDLSHHSTSNETMKDVVQKIREDKTENEMEALIDQHVKNRKNEENVENSTRNLTAHFNENINVEIPNLYSLQNEIPKNAANVKIPNIFSVQKTIPKNTGNKIQTEPNKKAPKIYQNSQNNPVSDEDIREHPRAFPIRKSVS